MITSNEAALFEQMRAWRLDFHRHPEFGFEERRTASIVAEELRRLGLDDVQESVGGTGVVGTLRRGQGNRTIALRADMDAVRITERGGHDHVSRNEGLMHACGHDGHTAMLLGATAVSSPPFPASVRDTASNATGMPWRTRSAEGRSIASCTKVHTNLRP